MVSIKYICSGQTYGDEKRQRAAFVRGIDEFTKSPLSSLIDSRTISTKGETENPRTLLSSGCCGKDTATHK